METREVEAIVFRVVDAFNAQLPPDRRLAKRRDAVVVGEGGVLDSLGVVNLVVSLEEELADALGAPVKLLSDENLAAADGPLRDLGALIDHVAKGAP